jgi:hypothetical protein
MKIRIAACMLCALATISAPGAVGKESAITPVKGEGWLQHLHRSFDETSMTN